MLGERVPERYERMLVPLLPIGQWPADLWIRNEGSESVDMFPLVRNADSPSRGMRFPLIEPGVLPGQTLDFPTFFGTLTFPYYIPLTTNFAGAVLYVESGKRRDVRFQLLVGDAQVPVVPEDDFVATPLSLMRITVVNGKRYTLRVYSLDSEAPNVQVAFEPAIGGIAVASEVLRLQRPAATALCAFAACPWPDVPFTPSYAAFFFDSARVPEWTYRITVTPDPGAKTWMFLSETDVVTRAVRIYTPN